MKATALARSAAKLARVEDRRDLPRVEIARPRDDLAEALRLRGAREGLRHQDGVDLLALQRLHGGRHGLERHDLHVGQREPVLLEDVADVVVERGAELGDADALALEIRDRTGARPSHSSFCTTMATSG